MWAFELGGAESQQWMGCSTGIELLRREACLRLGRVEARRTRRRDRADEHGKTRKGVVPAQPLYNCAHAMGNAAAATRSEC